jgi:lipopolysaccharide export system protein LptA
MRLGLVALATALAAAPALAERADREKQAVVVADKWLADEGTRESVFEGNVVVTQGTMRITAAKVTIREDKDRFKYYVASGAPVTFRQKRDKVDEWIEGVAERAEFDDKDDVLKLFNRAKVKSSQNEIVAEYITYDMRRELAQAHGAQPGTQAPESTGRVKVIIVPAQKPAPGAAKGETPRDAPKLKREEEVK